MPGALERDLAARSARQARVGEELTVWVRGGTVASIDAPEAPGLPATVRIRAQSFDVRVDVEESGCEPRPIRIALTHVVSPVGFEPTVNWHSFTVPATRNALDELNLERPEQFAQADWLAIDRQTPTEIRPTVVADARPGTMAWASLMDRGALAVLPWDPSVSSAPPPGACADIVAPQGVVEARRPMVVRHQLRAAETCESAGGEPVRFVVWGNNAGNDRRRALFIDDINRALDGPEPPLFVVVNGDLTENGNTRELSLAISALDELKIPWFATVGERDIDGSAEGDLVKRLGALSFFVNVGCLSVAVLDSADGSLARSAYARLEHWFEQDAAAEGEWSKPLLNRVVVTHVPPFDPYGLRGQGFKHRPEAGRFVAALKRGKVSTVISSHLATYREDTIAGVRFIHSGGGGAAMEGDSPLGHHWLMVVAEGCEIHVCPRLLDNEGHEPCP